MPPALTKPACISAEAGVEAVIEESSQPWNGTSADWIIAASTSAVAATSHVGPPSPSAAETTAGNGRLPGLDPQRRQRDAEERAAREEVLPGDARRGPRLPPAVDGADQLRHHQPHRQPQADEQRDVVGRHEPHHDDGESERPDEELRLVGAAGHVPPRVAVDDPAEERDDSPQQDRQPVDGDHAVDLPRAPEPDSGDERNEARGEKRPREPRQCGGRERRVRRRVRECSHRRVRGASCHRSVRRVTASERRDELGNPVSVASIGYTEQNVY